MNFAFLLSLGIKCSSQYYNNTIVKGKCVLSCPDSTYSNTTTMKCDSCDSTCDTCDGWGPSHCLTCSGSYYLYNS